MWGIHGGVFMSRFRFMIAVAILGWLVAPAFADTIANFTLDGVTFDDGGTASGGFTLDLTTGALSNVNITTSNTATFTGSSYSDGSSTNTFSNSSSPQFGFSEFVGFLEFFEGSILDINLGVILTNLNLPVLRPFRLRMVRRLFSSLSAQAPRAFVEHATLRPARWTSTPRHSQRHSRSSPAAWASSVI